MKEELKDHLMEILNKNLGEFTPVAIKEKIIKDIIDNMFDGCWCRYCGDCR